MSNIEDDIKIVAKFNKENRFRDCGKLNNAIDNLINSYEEHKKENGELREKVKKLEETIADYQRMYCRTMNDGISKQKIKELKENIHNIMDKNSITRAYQIVIDEQFKELLQESEDI